MRFFQAGRRKQYVVDKEFQLRTTLVGVVYIIAVTVSLGLLVGYLTRSMGLLLEAHSEELTELYYAQQRDMMMTTILFLISISVAWVLFTIWRTHKIAGPMVKLTRYIHNIAAGNFKERVQLRAKDELKALANGLNDLAECLEARDRAIKEEILSQIQLAGERIGSGHDPDHSSRVLEDLISRIEGRFECGFAPEPQPVESQQATEDLVHR